MKDGFVSSREFIERRRRLLGLPIEACDFRLEASDLLFEARDFLVQGTCLGIGLCKPLFGEAKSGRKRHHAGCVVSFSSLTIAILRVRPAMELRIEIIDPERLGLNAGQVHCHIDRQLIAA